MKKLFKTSLVILASLGLVGCGETSSSVEPTSESTTTTTETTSTDKGTSSSSSIVTPVTHTLTFAAPEKLLVGDETTFIASYDGSPLTPTEQAKVVYTASPADALTITGNKAVGAKVTESVTVTATYEGTTGTATLKVYEVTAKDRHDAYMAAFTNSASASSVETVTIQGVLKGYEQYSGNTSMNAYIQEGVYGYWVNNLPATDANGATISIGDSIQVIGTTYYGSKAKKYPCIKPTTTTKLTTAITADTLTLGDSSNVFADSRHAQIKAENITITEVSEDKSTFSFAIGSETYKFSYNSSATNTGDAIKAKLADVGVGRVITSIKGFWGNNATDSVNDSKIISVTSADDIVISETYPAATAVTITGSATIDGLNGAYETYTAIVTPSGAKQTVTWSVTDADGAATTIATISEAGVLTIANDVSTTTSLKVVATSLTEGVSGTLDVTVQPVTAPTSIEISATDSKNSINLDNNETIQLSITSTPANASRSVTWTSSNANVATVDANGVVTGVLDGVATITATSKYNSNITATYDVSVTRTITTIADLMTKGDALTATKGGDITGTYTVKGVLTAISNKNAILSDGTNALEIYSYSNMSDFASGNYVEVTGTFQRYYKLIETKSITSIVLAQTDDKPTIPTSESYDSSKVDALGANTGYVAGKSFSVYGQIQKSDNYTNLIVNGATYKLNPTACNGVTLTEKINGTFECVAVSTNTSSKLLSVFVTSFTADSTVAEPSAVEITNTETSIATGSSLQMTAFVSTAASTGNADQSVTWAVYAENGTNETTAATITSNGLLTAVSDGTIVVKATSTANSSLSASKTLTLSYKLTYDLSNKDKRQSASSYTDTWEATGSDESKLSVTGFNNNKNAWNCIKCGRKSYASVATLTTVVITKPISKVEFVIDSIAETDKINSIKLKVASDNAFTIDLQTISFTDYTKGTKDITVTTPTANMYYQLEFDMQAMSGNGKIAISSLSFIG